MLTDSTAESGSFWTEAVIECMLSVTERLVLNGATQILICTYKFRTDNKTVPPLCSIVSWNP